MQNENPLQSWQNPIYLKLRSVQGEGEEEEEEDGRRRAWTWRRGGFQGKGLEHGHADEEDSTFLFIIFSSS